MHQHLTDHIRQYRGNRFKSENNKNDFMTGALETTRDRREAIKLRLR